MNEPQWAQPFPGGVADAAGHHALLRDRAGHCVALSMADGRRLWRSTNRLQPLLAGPEGAVALAMQPPRVVSLLWSGEERWHSRPLPWPEWTGHLADLARNSDLHAAWLGSDVLLVWHLRDSPGGAGRGPGAGSEPAAGACRLAWADGTLAGESATRWAPPADTDNLPSDDPQVLAQRQRDGVRYALRQQAEGGTLRLSVTAADAQGPRWQCPLGELPLQRARPPLPR